MMKLKLVIASTRPGRKGPAIADAFLPLLQKNTAFQTELVDLADFNLPALDEPNHPRLRQYTKEHTLKWSAAMDEADAFVFVLPEYNFSAPGSVKNALDYLSQEWAYKPLAFISYGGVSGGLRSVDSMLPVFRAFKTVVIPEGVQLTLFTKHFDENGQFVPDEHMIKSAAGMMNELARWAAPLKTIRQNL